MTGFILTAAQAEQLSVLTAHVGELKVHDLGNPNWQGPLLVRWGEDEEALILASGDLLNNTWENAAA